MLVFGVFFAFLAGFIRTCPAQELKSTDYRTESEYLLQFTEFTEWPRPAGESVQRAFNFCALGRDPYGESLDEALLGRLVDGRRTVIVRGKHLQDLGGCDVLFIASATADSELSRLRKKRSYGVLTVGNQTDFTAQGGIIQLVKERGRIGFLINVDAAHRARLKISAFLLALAKIVHDEPMGGG